MDSFNVRRKLLYIAVLLKTPEGKPRLLISGNNNGDFKKEGVLDIMTSTANNLVEKTAAGLGASECVECDHHDTTFAPSICYMYIRDDNLSVVVIVEDAYPERVIHDLITKVLNEFAEKIPNDQWSTIEEGQAPFELRGYLSEYMYKGEKEVFNNHKVDETSRMQNAMMKLERDQDELIMEMHALTEAALQRGQSINMLVNMSASLEGAERFSRKRRVRSQCCVIL